MNHGKCNPHNKQLAQTPAIAHVVKTQMIQIQKIFLQNVQSCWLCRTSSGRRRLWGGQHLEQHRKCRIGGGDQWVNDSRSSLTVYKNNLFSFIFIKWHDVYCDPTLNSQSIITKATIFTGISHFSFCRVGVLCWRGSKLPSKVWLFSWWAFFFFFFPFSSCSLRRLVLSGLKPFLL